MQHSSSALSLRIRVTNSCSELLNLLLARPRQCQHAVNGASRQHPWLSGSVPPLSLTDRLSNRGAWAVLSPQHAGKTWWRQKHTGSSPALALLRSSPDLLVLALALWYLKAKDLLTPGKPLGGPSNSYPEVRGKGMSCSTSAQAYYEMEALCTLLPAPRHPRTDNFQQRCPSILRQAPSRGGAQGCRPSPFASSRLPCRRCRQRATISSTSKPQVACSLESLSSMHDRRRTAARY